MIHWNEGQPHSDLENGDDGVTVIWWVLIWNNIDHIQCLVTLNSDDDSVGKYYQHSQFYNGETELTRLSKFPTLMYLEYIYPNPCLLDTKIHVFKHK